MNVTFRTLRREQSARVVLTNSPNIEPVLDTEIVKGCCIRQDLHWRISLAHRHGVCCVCSPEDISLFWVLNKGSSPTSAMSGVLHPKTKCPYL